ncbi:MAG: DivIVA domain-containing protein [Monoglobaceae bacterium]
MVTPQDIAEKGFRISFRGYNTEEVDDFLQEIYNSYIEIYEANQKLNETTGRLSDAVGQYKSMEDTLNDALNIAGRSADEIEESAHSKAAEIIKNAELAASSIIAGAEQKISAEEYRLENIKREIETYKSKVLELLNAQLCVLNEYPESASLNNVGSASEKDAPIPMWKKHKSSANGKVFAKPASDISDTRQAPEKPAKEFEKSKNSEEDTDFSKTVFFEPVDITADASIESGKPEVKPEAKPGVKPEVKPESNINAKSDTDAAPKPEAKAAKDNSGSKDNSGRSDDSSEAKSDNNSYYEMMKEQVFGNSESVRPTRDTTSLPFVSMNENGGYTIRK